MNDRDRRADQCSGVGERNQSMQQRPLLMQPPQLLRRQLSRKIAFELLRVIGVINPRTAIYPIPRTDSIDSAFRYRQRDRITAIAIRAHRICAEISGVIGCVNAR